MRLGAVLPPGAVHQGIAVLADPLEDPGVESLSKPPENAEDAEVQAGRDVVLVLAHVTDPRNVGALLPSAAAFGPRSLVVTSPPPPETPGPLATPAAAGPRGR